MMRVLSVASEAYPLVKTGGLADVVGALPGALAPHGIEITTLIPGYPAVLAGIEQAAPVHEYAGLMGHQARLLKASLAGHPLLVLDAPALFQRPGGPYDDPKGIEWKDNWQRFAALGRAAADLACGAIAGHAFDILQAHDWQAALAPTYLRYSPGTAKPASMLTVHNIAFQGRFEQAVFPLLGLPAEAYSIDGPYSEKWKKQLFFASAVTRKNYVSFYLMPVYMYPDLLQDISPGLKKRMQGKSCFNFKKLEPALFDELATLTHKSAEKFKQENPS